jgi:hypothetical protein
VYITSVELQRPTAAGQLHVVRKWPGEADEGEDEANQPLGLTQDEAIDGPDGKCRRDRGVCEGAAAGRCTPPFDCLGRDP